MFGHFTYIVFLLAWAIPALALQWWAGARVLYAHARVLVIAALVSTTYLSAADSVALHAGIWVIHADRVLGPAVGNVPIEESLFFLATNLLVIQTVILVTNLRSLTLPGILAWRGRENRS